MSSFKHEKLHSYLGVLTNNWNSLHVKGRSFYPKTQWLFLRNFVKKAVLTIACIYKVIICILILDQAGKGWFVHKKITLYQYIVLFVFAVVDPEILVAIVIFRDFLYNQTNCFTTSHWSISSCYFSKHSVFIVQAVQPF